MYRICSNYFKNLSPPSQFNVSFGWSTCVLVCFSWLLELIFSPENDNFVQDNGKYNFVGFDQPYTAVILFSAGDRLRDPGAN
jgi:hypothetical protein